MRTHGFKQWLITNYKHDYSPIGDLARDIIQDKCFPYCTTFKKAYRHLTVDHCASDACLDVLIEAWKLYKPDWDENEVNRL